MIRTLSSIAILAIILIGFFVVTDLSSVSSNAPVTIMGTAVPPIPTLDPDSVASGKHLYNQYCASCHGANLAGVPNWKVSQPDGSLLPPPHDSSGHTWHHPDPILIEITTNGGDPTLFNTKMPGYGDLEVLVPMGFRAEGTGLVVAQGFKTFSGSDTRYVRYYAEKLTAGTRVEVTLHNKQSSTAEFECELYLYPR